MTKHDPIAAPSREPSPDLIRRVEEAYRSYRTANGGKNPTRAQLNDVVRTSLGPLCKAARIVEDKLDAIETKLATMPSMPEELQTMLTEFQAALWARTQELGNSELVAYRRSAEMQEQRHRREVEQTLEIVESVEAQRNDALRRANEAGATIETLRDELATTVASLASASVRVEELRDLFTAMTRQSMSDAEEGKKKPAARSERRASKSDEPETGNLPGISPPEASDGPDPAE